MISSRYLASYVSGIPTARIKGGSSVAFVADAYLDTAFSVVASASAAFDTDLRHFALSGSTTLGIAWESTNSVDFSVVAGAEVTPEFSYDAKINSAATPAFEVVSVSSSKFRVYGKAAVAGKAIFNKNTRGVIRGKGVFSPKAQQTATAAFAAGASTTYTPTLRAVSPGMSAIKGVADSLFDAAIAIPSIASVTAAGLATWTGDMLGSGEFSIETTALVSSSLELITDDSFTPLDRTIPSLSVFNRGASVNVFTRR